MTDSAILFAVLTQADAARVTNTAFLKGERHKLDTDQDYCSSDPLPFFLEDYAYHSTGYTSRESAIRAGRNYAAELGWNGFVLVTLTFDGTKVPADGLAVYTEEYEPGQELTEAQYIALNTPTYVDANTRAPHVTVFPMAARYLNENAQHTLERIAA